jgi:eukaryotic-like serine/threonine-protein kinase
MAPAKLGRYEITGKLGEGAMGVVYQARDPLLERSVAVKTVSLALSQDELAVFEQRFYREAKSAGRLGHPNIVTIYDVGKSEGFAYIAMEFLKGRSLREILDSGVILRVEQAVHIAAQVADGLAFAHQHGIVHRDIKPANIMVLENGTAKITDFGIAVIPTGSSTFSGNFGSPKYMSPEQIAGQGIDARSDVFSLCTVLYEMLTGVPAFTGEQLDTILYRVINETPPPPSERNRLVPPTLDALVAKGLEKRPENRYQSAQEIATELKRHRRKRLSAISKPKLAVASTAAIASRPTGGEETVLIPNPRAATEPAAEPTSSTKIRALGAHPRKPAIIAAFCAGVLIIAGVLLWHPWRRAEIVEAAAVQAAPRNEVAAASSVSPEPIVTPSAPTPAQGAEQAPPAQPDRPAIDQPPTAVIPAVATARLAFAVSPWGEVYVDGKRRGVSPPLTEVSLAPGKHTVEIRNSSLPPYQERVELLADKTLKIKHKFQ